MNPVTARHLTKYFNGLCAVDHISFDVYPGECLGVLGPNGAGKTTTLRMIIGQTIPTGGELKVLGYTMPKDAERMRERIGVVPQLDNLDADFTVRENLRVYASYFGLSGKIIRQRIDELLEFTQLTEKADASVNALSGGMRRRLILARALINNPELLILDEPTTGLDPQARQLLWQRLRKLKNEGATLILTTHYMEEAERLCDRILLVDHGKILAEGSPRNLISQTIEPQVIEINVSDHRENELLNHLPVERTEIVGETLFCYTLDEKPLIAYLKSYPQFEFLHRRANLEDVFVKLTGRELRET